MQPIPRKGTKQRSATKFPASETHEDETNPYFEECVRDVEIRGREIIETGAWLVARHPDLQELLYRDFHDRLTQAITISALGPASIAAGVLLEQLRAELDTHFYHRIS
jgi:hypothetical protein